MRVESLRLLLDVRTLFVDSVGLLACLDLCLAELLAEGQQFVLVSRDSGFEFDEGSGGRFVHFREAGIHLNTGFFRALVDVTNRIFQCRYRRSGLRVFQLTFKINESSQVEIVVRLDDRCEFSDSGKGLFKVAGEFVQFARLGEAGIFDKRNAGVEPVHGSDDGGGDSLVGLHQTTSEFVESACGRDDREFHLGDASMHALVNARVERCFKDELLKGVQAGTNQIQLRGDFEESAVGRCLKRVQGQRARSGRRNTRVCRDIRVGCNFWPEVVRRRSGCGVVAHVIPRVA